MTYLECHARPRSERYLPCVSMLVQTRGGGGGGGGGSTSVERLFSIQGTPLPWHSLRWHARARPRSCRRQPQAPRPSRRRRRRARVRRRPRPPPTCASPPSLRYRRRRRRRRQERPGPSLVHCLCALRAHLYLFVVGGEGEWANGERRVMCRLPRGAVAARRVHATTGLVTGHSRQGVPSTH